MDERPCEDCDVDEDLPPRYKKVWRLIEVAGADDKDCRFAVTRLMILQANIHYRQVSHNQKSQRNPY